jgi:hypothetical protein
MASSSASNHKGKSKYGIWKLLSKVAPRGKRNADLAEGTEHYSYTEFLTEIGNHAGPRKLIGG